MTVWGRATRTHRCHGLSCCAALQEMVCCRYALVLAWLAVWCLLNDVCYRQAPNKTSLVVKHDVLPVPTHGTRGALSDTGPCL